MLFGEEVVELDVPVVFRRAADPLTVADDQIAKLAVRIQLVEKAVGIARPRDELVFHLNAGFFGKILAKLDKGIGGIPCRPAQRELFALRSSRTAGNNR